jgi:hypothetical protein
LARRRDRRGNPEESLPHEDRPAVEAIIGREPNRLPSACHEQFRGSGREVEFSPS